tara:strand:+ start:24 stop:491 length:468 start_codon:yes stop_codon:yes gene_type:complete
MADGASVSISATILPDEIATTISGTMAVAPDDANDKWYYKLTACTTTSTDLIAGSFLDYTAVDDDTAPTAVHTADKVKFLFIQNTSSGDGVYVCFDGAAAVNSGVDNVFIGPEQTWFGRLPNTTVANLHAISSDIDGTGDATANIIVAALLDDVA